MAKLKKKNELAGIGCLIQAIGLMLLAVWPLGTVAGVGMLIYGSIKSQKLMCSNCGNKIDSNDIIICPTCKETIENK